MAKCQQGFIGSYVSACYGTAWQTPSGACLPTAAESAIVAAASQQAVAVQQSQLVLPPTCINNSTSVSCYADPSICWGVPPGPNPPHPNSTVWLLLSASHATAPGSAVFADCHAPLAGNIISYCIQGKFAPAVGRCYLDPNRCYKPPDTTSDLRIQDWKTAPFWASGDAMVTECINDYLYPVRQGIPETDARSTATVFQ
jgi:hypothetical protein